MKKNFKLALLMAFCLTVTACGKKEEKQSENKVEKQLKTEINYGITSSPEGKFNPLFSNTQYDGNINALVYDSLLKLNSKLELEPAMAEKYEISEDGKKVVFTLKDGLKFHDGKPVTSKDVKFTLEAMAIPDSLSVVISAFLILEMSATSMLPLISSALTVSSLTTLNTKVFNFGAPL